MKKKAIVDLVFNGVGEASQTSTAQSLMSTYFSDPGGPSSEPVDQANILLTQYANLSIIDMESKGD